MEGLLYRAFTRYLGICCFNWFTHVWFGAYVGILEPPVAGGGAPLLAIVFIFIGIQESRGYIRGSFPLTGFETNGDFRGCDLYVVAVMLILDLKSRNQTPHF